MKKLLDENIQFQLTNLDARVTEIERRIKSFDAYSCADNPDMLLEKAKALAQEYDMVSASLFQRRFSIGYARAARLLDQLEKKGIVGPGEGSKPRKVCMKE